MGQTRARTALAAPLLMLAGALLPMGVADGDSPMKAASAENPVAESGCVIRYDRKTSAGNTKPRIHANSTHTCVGVKRVYADYRRGTTVVELDRSRPVVAMSITSDETLLARGIQCGGSGGGAWIHIHCFDRSGRVKAHSSRMFAKTANVWVVLLSWDRSAT